MQTGFEEEVFYNQVKGDRKMRAKLYENRPNKNNTYFYSILFVGQERPFICCSSEYEYYVIRDAFLKLANEGELEVLGIDKGTSAIVRRIDLMKQTSFNSDDASRHLRVLQRQMDALNNPERPKVPADLKRFMEDRDEELKDEAESFSLESVIKNVDWNASKEDYITKMLERKYRFIYKDILKQWNHLQKEQKQENEKVLEVA